MQKTKNSIRPAWIEIDLKQLKKNFSLIRRDLPKDVGFISVIKDNAYGHGAVEVGKIALSFGATYLAVATVDEALELRKAIPKAPIMIFGERTNEELEICLKHSFVCCLSDIKKAKYLDKLAKKMKKMAIVHFKINTGMNRYGARFDEAPKIIEQISKLKNINLEGVMSHFSMSDELDKTFAYLQLERFEKVLSELEKNNLKIKYRHICNSGGFLDLPQAHFNMVRVGILPLGVYPSEVCRRIPGIKPVMSVKCKVASIQNIQIGDCVGYGMHYRAESPRKIATLPIGYGDGYPRVRNIGEVIINNKRAKIVGGNAMDATMIDVTDIPKIKLWDKVTLMGKEQNEEITAREIGKWRNSISYNTLTAWSPRLPRIYK